MRENFMIMVVLLVWPAVAAAQSQRTPNVLKLDAKENQPKATLADAAWLEGHWVGTGLGGECEEIWAPARGGSMIGMFRCIRDGKIFFTEFFMLVEESGSLVLKVKHFGPDFSGWEEKDRFVSFPLAKISPRELNFDGATMRKLDDGRLDMFVAVKQRNGEVREEAFHYRAAARRAGEAKPQGSGGG